MLLRASGEITGDDYQLDAIGDPTAAATSGVAHAAELIALTRARDPRNVVPLCDLVRGQLRSIEVELGRERGSLSSEELLARAGFTPESAGD